MLNAPVALVADDDLVNKKSYNVCITDTASLVKGVSAFTAGFQVKEFSMVWWDAVEIRSRLKPGKSPEREANMPSVFRGRSDVLS